MKVNEIAKTIFFLPLQSEPSFLTDQTLKSPSSKESVLPEVNINTEVPLKEDPTRPPANKEFPVTGTPNLVPRAFLKEEKSGSMNEWKLLSSKL